MDVSRRRAGVKTNVATGSVWESRMKLNGDGAFKVFNGDSNSEESTVAADSPRKVVKKSPVGSTTGKRKTWKSDSSCDGTIQIGKSSVIKNSDEQCKELSVSADGIKKSSIVSRKGKSDVSVDGIDKSPILGKKGKSRSDIKEVLESSNPQLRKVKSVESGKDIGIDSGIGRNSILLKISKSEPTATTLDDELVIRDSVISGVDLKSPPVIEEINGSEESCKEFDVCQENVISSDKEANEALSPPILVKNKETVDDVVVLDGGEELEEDENEEQDQEIDEEMEMEIEVEKMSVDIKEIKVTETKQAEEKPEKMEIKAEQEEEKPKKVEIKASQEEKPKKVEISLQEQKPKKAVVNENKNIYQFRNRTSPISSTVNKQPPPVLRRATIYQNLANAKPSSIPVTNEYQNFPETHNKLQNLVDLVMWKDISRSAFVFGIGTFIIVSSSYTKDLNVSFISVISYLGLVYLAAIFLYRSLICRGVIDIDDTRYVLGEEEAIWLLKLVLPYLNECLLKIRALFSGDPSTTMKLAVLLFVFARCGTSITIWKMAKLGFFGVFTVPKVCSSYSTQLTAYGKFWIRRLRDAWDSCSHKKAVALAIFTLVWNLSTMVARVWAVFMMFVAVRYYQQKMESEDWAEDDDVGDDEILRHDVGPTPVEVNKVKKGC
ncbi:hypothetical protein JCGZ_04021 [Jatropha curcas]|uniref:Reticulon-like protein n=1 Tax=Jatropha curcas TaxID=180498 RepID=A0A067KUN1_JATCU|nr:hypothetical protein JCGZ_04021 [Jatropha curcas]